MHILTAPIFVNDTRDEATEIGALRDLKLSRLKFRYEPSEVRTPGKPANFLSRRLIAEFDIPCDVPVSAHTYSSKIVDLIQSNPNKLFLDVGAGLRDTYYDNVINLDIYPAISTDVISVAEDLPFADEQFDFVFSFAVMEHVKRPWDVAREKCRVLKPGGVVIVDYPFMWPMHGYPHHYFNATPQGNRSLFEDECEIITVEPEWHHHPAAPLQWMLKVWHDGLDEQLGVEFSNLTIGQLIDWPLDDLLDQLFAKELRPSYRRIIAGGSTLVGIKKAPDATGQETLRRDAMSEHDIIAMRSIQNLMLRYFPEPAEDYLYAEMPRLRGELAELKQAIAAMRLSSSWRITAPLRRMVGLLRALITLGLNRNLLHVRRIGRISKSR